MRKLTMNSRLLIVFSLLLLGFGITHYSTIKNENKALSQDMNLAVELTKEWFNIVKAEKEIREIKSDAFSNVPNSFMLGDDYTSITSTLGSINAKEISTNPDFSALIVRYINEIEIQKGEKIGLMLSGSFPSLSISTLAALQTLGFDVVMMSSLGASSYGANQPNATWIDIENWLIEKGDLKYSSVLVSLGAENDHGLGLMDEGINQLKAAAYRNNTNLFLPNSIGEAIAQRKKIFEEENIALFINIGGNHAAMGNCTHAVTLPNGLNTSIPLCEDLDRGLIQELSALGIPVINLLNIKELAFQYGMDINPGIDYAASSNLYGKTTKNRLVQLSVLIICVLSMLILKIEKKKN
jgi:poly-gamma-glutamate system protein